MTPKQDRLRLQEKFEPEIYAIIKTIDSSYICSLKHCYMFVWSAFIEVYTRRGRE